MVLTPPEGDVWILPDGRRMEKINGKWKNTWSLGRSPGFGVVPNGPLDTPYPTNQLHHNGKVIWEVVFDLGSAANTGNKVHPIPQWFKDTVDEKLSMDVSYYEPSNPHVYYSVPWGGYQAPVFGFASTAVGNIQSQSYNNQSGNRFTARVRYTRLDDPTVPGVNSANGAYGFVGETDGVPYFTGIRFGTRPIYACRVDCGKLPSVNTIRTTPIPSVVLDQWDLSVSGFVPRIDPSMSFSYSDVGAVAFSLPHNSALGGGGNIACWINLNNGVSIRTDAPTFVGRVVKATIQYLKLPQYE